MLLTEHRQLRDHDDRLQAMWLAESGLQRASVRLAGSADYTGETWVVSAESLGGDRDGRVEICVEPVADEPNARRVHVTADYPAESEYRKRHSKHIQLSLTTTGETR